MSEDRKRCRSFPEAIFAVAHLLGISYAPRLKSLDQQTLDQEIAEACNRLIKNSIICWNYLYLEHKLATLRDVGQKQRLMTAIAGHSMLSWAHVNLLGEYDLSDEKLRDSFGLRPSRAAS